MPELKECIKEQIHISNEDLDNIVSNFKSKSLKKGEYFLRQQTICNELAFIKSGYLRMFDIVDGNEITIWIGGPKSFITSLSSFIFKTINYWNIQAVTDCDILTIDRETHFKMNKEYPKWLEFDNHLLANSYSKLEKRMFDQIHKNAEERFLSLLENNPHLFNHVPLQYIASMLGITPETLSRLRKSFSTQNS